MLFVCNLPGLFWCFSYYKTRVQGGQVSLSSSAYCFPCSGHHVELIRGFPNESSCIQIYNDILTSQGLERQEQPMRCFELPVPFFDHQAIGSILPAPVRICNWTRCFWETHHASPWALSKWPSGRFSGDNFCRVQICLCLCRKEWAEETSWPSGSLW